MRLADRSFAMHNAVFSRFTIVSVAACCAAPAAFAQFDDVQPATDYVESISGQLLSAEGAPTVEPGDQVATYFGDQIIGVYTFSSTQPDPREWDMIIYGDDPDTGTVKEGPAFGDPITFRFYDSSTNTIRQDVAPTNAGGEVITVVFEGELTFQLPINIPGAPPFPGAPGPSIPFDLTLGIAAPNPPTNGGGNGGGETPTGNPDVNGDGVIDKMDAALVLRIQSGAFRGVSAEEAGRADVNGDGVVNTRDAIAIMSKRSLFPTPA